MSDNITVTPGSDDRDAVIAMQREYIEKLEKLRDKMRILLEQKDAEIAELASGLMQANARKYEHSQN